MGKRDAFGNEIDGDDNPLDAMGWKLGGEQSGPAVSVEANDPTGVASAPPAPAPAPPVPPVMTASSATPRFEAPRMPTQLPNIPSGSSFNAFGTLARLIPLAITLVILGGVGIGVYSAIDSAKDTVNSISIPRFTTPNVSVPAPATPQSGTPAKPAQPPTGLSRGSMLRATQFGNLLSAARKVGSRVQTMRVDPTRVSVNVLAGDGKLTIVSAPWDGNVEILRTQSNLSGVSTTSLDAITSKAPSRAVARAAKLLGKRASSVNYLAFLKINGGSWYVYFKDGKYVRASLDGRSVQRVG